MIDDSFSVLGNIEANLVQKRVGIEEFAESSKYCGKALYPKQRLLLKLIFLEDLTDQEEVWLDEWIASPEIKIAPDIRDRIKWCKDHGYPHFREIVLVGGRRSSKGFLTGVVLAKKMYDTLQLQDPNQHYGIDQDKEIYFTCVAASEKQAKELQYSDFSNTVGSCHAMQPYIYKNQELEFSVQTEKDLRKREMYKRQGKQRIQRDISTLRGRAIASNQRTLRGYTSMGIVFDEMAFFMQGESDSADEAVYEAAIPSLAQFGQDGILFCNSSPYTKVGKFFERFEVSQELSEEKWAPMVMGIQFPSWAMFEDWWEDPNFMGARKSITVSPDWDPEKLSEYGGYFYTNEDRNNIEVERARERDNPDSFKVERRAQWAEVIDAYLDPDMVDRMVLGRPLANGAGYEPFNTNWIESSYLRRYKAHLDPSSTTAGFGFALGHSEPLILHDEHGEPFESEHVVFDIVKRWKPDSFHNGVIDWEVVIKEVLHYADIFRPYEITFDQFQSAAPMQMMSQVLRSKGMSDIRVYEKTATAVHNYKRAEVFKTALYMNLIHTPGDTDDIVGPGGVVDELKYLQEIRTGRTPRIDKQDVGPVTTKDMADCMMEVVESLIGNEIANVNRHNVGMPASFGSAGGYPIGGPDAGGYGQITNPSDPMIADLYTRRIGEQRGPGTQGRSGRQGMGGRNPARGRTFRH